METIWRCHCVSKSHTALVHLFSCLKAQSTLVHDMAKTRIEPRHQPIITQTLYISFVVTKVTLLHSTKGVSTNSLWNILKFVVMYVADC